MPALTPSLDYFLPYQVAWITDESPLSIGEKSRRIGWTYASSYRAVERRLRRGTNLYFSSADLSTAKEFIDYCKKWADVANVAAREAIGEDVIEDQKITSFVLTFDNKAKIVAGSSNPKFFRGKGGDADGDEFAFHGQPRELFKAMQPTALFAGHQLRLWSTHNGEGSYFNSLLADARSQPPRLKARLHRVTILDAVEQGLVEKLFGLKGRDDKARQEWLDTIRSTVPDDDAWNEEFMCQPSSEQSSLLGYDLIRGCERAAEDLRVVDDPREIRFNGAIYAGMDVGRERDLTVFWALGKVGDVFETLLIRPFHQATFTEQEDFFHLLMRRDVRRLCLDKTGIGIQLSERMTQRYGHRVEGVHFSAPVKAELAMPLRRLFEDKLVRVPADPDVREDLHKVRKLVTAAGNVRFDAKHDEKGHADRFWALALAYHAADDSKVPLPAPLLRKPVGW
jgi:phage FluMu gp28-like protein